MVPVDLTLERSGSSFVPQNPITEVELPGSAEEPIRLQSGIEVDLPTSGDRTAEPLGDMNLFYPETETASDTLVAPMAGGVEVFEQLRSPESPERFDFALRLPKEATLRPSEAGGAEILSSSGKTIAEVPPSSATDAQGAPVPVTTSVEGDSLVLEVSHRSGEVAYPVLLDPAYVTDTTSFGEWGPYETAEYSLGNSGWLSAISKGHHWYGANTFGQWAYGAYGSTAYVYWANFSPVNFYVHTCSNTQPHGYIGIYNVNSASYEGHLGTYSGGDSSGRFSLGPYENVGNRDAIVGIGTAAAGIEIGCAHELWVGGTTIEEKDPEAPTINSVGGTSSSWVKESRSPPTSAIQGWASRRSRSAPKAVHRTRTRKAALAPTAVAARGAGKPASASPTSSKAKGAPASPHMTRLAPTWPRTSPPATRSPPGWTARNPKSNWKASSPKRSKKPKKKGKGKIAPALHLPVYNLKIEATDKATRRQSQNRTESPPLGRQKHRRLPRRQINESSLGSTGMLGARIQLSDGQDLPRAVERSAGRRRPPPQSDRHRPSRQRTRRRKRTSNTSPPPG